MRFNNKIDALNYMTKIKDDNIKQYTNDYNNVLLLCSNLNNKSSVKKLISDVVCTLRQNEYKYIRIWSRWIVCTNSTLGDSADFKEKIFSYSNYGLDDIKEQRVCLALMHIICTELEKTGIIYYIDGKVSLRAYGAEEFWQTKGLHRDSEYGDNIRYCYRKIITNPIKGSEFIAKKLKVQKDYCTITESQRIYRGMTSHDYYKDYKLAAAFNKRLFQEGGSYILNCCELVNNEFSNPYEISLIRRDLMTRTEKWV